MNTGYSVNGQDLGNLLEFFTLEEQGAYSVVDSQFTNGSQKYNKGGTSLRNALGGTFPISAGTNYPGGYNTIPVYKIAGEPVDVALKGYRPIGIPLKDVGAGTYVLYRSGGKTYFTTGTSPSGGEELPHNPVYVFFEMQGAGGGGGGSVDLYSGSGGGSGAYFFGSILIDSPIYITVGSGGAGGVGKALGKGNDGEAGADSTISVVFNGTQYTLTAQSGKGGEGGNNGNSGGAGGDCVFSPIRPSDINSCVIINDVAGVYGTSRRTPPSDSNAMQTITNVWLKPEGGSFVRPGGSGGYSKDTAGYGGGGGASTFGDGGGGGYQRDGYVSDAFGAGGGGGGNYVGRKNSGASGSDGRFVLYY